MSGPEKTRRTAAVGAGRRDRRLLAQEDYGRHYANPVTIKLEQRRVAILVRDEEVADLVAEELRLFAIAQADLEMLLDLPFALQQSSPDQRDRPREGITRAALRTLSSTELDAPRPWIVAGPLSAERISAMISSHVCVSKKPLTRNGLKRAPKSGVVVIRFAP